MVAARKKDAILERFRNPFLKIGAHHTGRRLTADEWITNNEHLKEEFDAE